MKAPKRLVLLLVLCAVVVAGTPVGSTYAADGRKGAPAQVAPETRPDSGYWGDSANWWVIQQIFRHLIEKINGR